MDLKLQKAFACLDCGNALKNLGNGLECGQCRRVYPIKNGVAIFHNLTDVSSKQKSDSLLFYLKSSLRNYPGLFRFLYKITTPVFGKAPSVILKKTGPDALIINLGSGVISVNKNIIDVDFQAYPNVSVAADITKLPFRDGSVDAVVSESLLEHVADAQRAIQEFKRVLRPGGWIYVAVPFMLGFHSAPGDYYRWTSIGLEEVFKDFEERESGVACGPTLAFTRMAGEWLSLVLSFGFGALHQFWSLFFILIFLPVNLLDVIFIHYPFAKNMPMSVYFMGRKK